MEAQKSNNESKKRKQRRIRQKNSKKRKLSQPALKPEEVEAKEREKIPNELSEMQPLVEKVSWKNQYGNIM